MKKRVLSMLLVLVMVVGMIPMAMAEEAAAEETVVTLDFNADAANGVTVANATEAANGWAWYAAGSVNAKSHFYNTTNYWDANYKVLRIYAADTTVAELSGALSFVAPKSGNYNVDVTYICTGDYGSTEISVGGREFTYSGAGSWANATVLTVSETDVALNEGSNLMTMTSLNGTSKIYIEKIVFTLVEETEDTKVALDFNADAAKGKTPAQFTVATDGWGLDTANSANVSTSQFYKRSNEGSAWDYSVLRINGTSPVTAGIAFYVPVAGTYRMDMTYALGNNSYTTKVTVGGTETDYNAYATWGAAPKSVTTHEVKLEKGTNLMTVTGNAAMILLKDVTFTLVEQEGVFGLDFNRYYKYVSKKVDEATIENNGWTINTDETTAAVDFYKFGGNDNYAAWDYTVLRGQGSGTTLAIDFATPVTGSYKMILTYARGNNSSLVDVTVGGKTAQYNGYAPYGSETQEVVMDGLFLEAGTNTISFVPTGALVLLKDIKFIPVDTVVEIDFDVEFNKDKHDGDGDVSVFTIEEDGWAYNTEESYNMTPGWYRYVDTNHEDENGDSTWGYRVLRLVQTAEGSLGVIDFPVALPGTYTMKLEYAVGNNGNATEAYVGGTTTAFHGYAKYGDPYKTISTEGVELTQGVNSIEFAVKGAAGQVFVKKLTFTLIEMAETPDVPDVPVCDHAETDVEYLDNYDGTHTVDTSCAACGAVISSEIEDCYDYEDGVCICGAAVETACAHENTASAGYVDNGDKTHTALTTCVDCGETVSEEIIDCADEDKDCLCDDCGGTYVTIEKFSMAGSNMTLGNELEVNFLFLKKNLTATDCTAIVTHYMADGTTKVTEIAQADWGAMGSTYHKVSTRIAAKEMADTLTIEIVDADGYVLNNEYSDSARGYAGRALANSSTTEYVRVMMIDMLNYGAAAQEHFKYNTSDLANNALTEEQQALATAKVTCTNGQVKDATIYGSNLSLEDSILLNTFFKGLKNKDVTTMYAMVNFTDFEGKAKEVRMEGTEFEKYGSSGDIYKIVVDDVVLADAKQLVTVTLYNADGTVFGAGTDSVESYVARAESNNADTYGLYANIMKFATSAYNYIINK